MRHKLILLFTVFLIGLPSVQSQKLDKGFKALSEKDFFKSKRIFTKSMYGYPTTGAYGLSLMFYEQQNPFFSLDSALKYITFADSAIAMADKKEEKMIQRFAITKSVFGKHRQKIASKAFDLLGSDALVSDYQNYLNTYPFSDKYIQVVTRRDSVAFNHARVTNTYDAYRDFIINYPGSKLRSEADSLYAKSFFKTKVGDGEVSAYKQFVKDFPASPYIEDAYDQIFSNVRSLDTKEAYNEFITDYPENTYTELAWKSLIGIILKEEYSEKSLASILADYPLNPLNAEVETELKGYFVSFFPMELDGKWGYVRGDGELSILPEYEEAGPFVEGLAVVQKRGRRGFINKKGETVITIEYDEVGDFDSGLSVVEKDGEYGMIDRRNKVVLPIDFDDVGQLSGNRILVEDDGLIGYFDISGEQVIDFKYENGVDFNGDYAVVKSQGMYGLIDADDKIIIPFEYDWIESTENDRVRVKQGSAFGLMTKSGEEILPLEYDWIGPVDKNSPIVLQKENKIGYLNSSNEISIPLTYDADTNQSKGASFNGGFARVQQNGKYGVIDKDGIVVLEISYDTLGTPSENFVSFRNKGRWGFRELVGSRRIIEPRFDDVEPFVRGVSIVRVGDKFGVIDPNGINVLNEEYSSIFSEKTIGLLVVKKNGLTGLMDRDKNLILGFKYKSVEIKNFRYAKTIDPDGVVSFYDLQKNSFIWPQKK